MELKDIKITIDLSQWFNVNYWRKQVNPTILTVTEEWIQQQGLRSVEGIENLLHFRTILDVPASAIATIVEIWRIEDWKSTIVAKEIQSEIKKVEFSEAVEKNKVIEDWKRGALFKLMKTGRVDKNKASEIILAAMNPTSELDKQFAIKLQYPFRDEIKPNE